MITGLSISRSSKLIFLSLIFSVIGLYLSNTFIGLAHAFLFFSFLFFIKEGQFHFNYFTKLPTLKFFIAFLFFLVLSLLMNWNQLEQPWKLLFKLKYFVFGLLSIPLFFHFFNGSENKNKKKQLIWFLFILTSLATISGLIGLWTGYNPLKFSPACDPTRNCGMSGMLMTYSYSISIFCSLLLASIVHFKKNNIISKRNLIIFFIINFVGLYFTYSRGALLGFLVGVPFIFLGKKKKGFKYLLTILLVLLMSLGYLVYKNKNVDFYRLNFMPKREMERVSLVYTAAHIFRDNPIFGIGYRNFEPSVPYYKAKYDLNKIHTFTGHAHNNYLEILAGAGFFAFFFYCLFIGSWLRMCLKSNIFFLTILTSPLINFSFSGLFQSTIIDGEITFFFMLLFGLAISQQLKQSLDGSTK